MEINKIQSLSFFGNPDEGGRRDPGLVTLKVKPPGVGRRQLGSDMVKLGDSVGGLLGLPLVWSL